MQEGRTMQFPRSQEEKKGVMALLRAHHPSGQHIALFFFPCNNALTCPLESPDPPPVTAPDSEPGVSEWSGLLRSERSVARHLAG